MKKITGMLAILFVTMLCQLYAQPVLYGLTSEGGNGQGVLIKLDAGINQLTTEYSWKLSGRNPYKNDFVEVNGKLYGMVSGGTKKKGVIFSIDLSNNTYVELYNFDGADGSTPVGSLVVGNNGILYGATNMGGSSNLGTFFSFDLSTNTHMKLHDFSGIDGSYPNCSMVKSVNGILYGVTNTGGNNGAGTIFSFDPGNNAHIKLHDFTIANGSGPTGLLLTGNGILYGSTSAGGNFGTGTIFTFDLSNNTHSKLYDFTNSNVRGPTGSLVQTPNGYLYGMTTYGGADDVGTIFSFDPANNTYASLYDLDINAYSPFGSLVESDGKLYGLTWGGSINQNGAIFSFDPANNTQEVLFTFDGANGSKPKGNLVKTTSGKFYAMTDLGGSANFGTIFSFDPATKNHVKLHDFANNGSQPYGSLIKATNGKLYGMTNFGGGNNGGTIFSYDPNTQAFEKIYDFRSLDGLGPNGELLQADNGKLYGVTAGGGTYGYGTIFSFDLVTNTYTSHYNLNETDGAGIFSHLIQADNGKLYGMTNSGGSLKYGTIFSFDPVTNTHTLLKEFNKTNGSYPQGGLVQASNGKLYGVGGLGGSFNKGTIFSYDPVTNTQSTVFTFNSTLGELPNGNLIQARNGKLYGMTFEGGISNGGTIFSFDPATNTHLKLHEFSTMANGFWPNGSLFEASDGKLYGMTTDNAGGYLGTVFSFDPVTNTHTKLQSFNRTNGAFPIYGTLVEASPCTSTTEICDGVDNDCDGQIDEGCPPNNQPYIFISNSSITEGNIGNPNMVFKLWLSKKSSTPVTIQYQTVKNSATDPEDFIGKSGTITFPANTLNQTLSIQVKGDKLNEADESFIVNLINPVNGSFGISTANGTILNDDPLPVLSIDDASAAENSQKASVKVYLMSKSGQIVKVKYATLDKSALSPADFTATQGQLIFNPGETVKFIDINIKKDNLIENTESFEVKLTDIVNAKFDNNNGVQDKAQIKIINSGSPGLATSPLTGEAALIDQALQLQVKVQPNPSSNYFQLNFSGGSRELIHLRITDLLGRVLEDRKIQGNFQQIQVGEKWQKGYYFLEVEQGRERKMVQLIKLK